MVSEGGDAIVSSRRVLATYFTIAGLYTLAAALIWGVNTLFLLAAGLDIFEVFLANAAFTAGSVLFELPTGVLADSRGRRASFLLSAGVLAVTTLAYVAVAHYGGGLCAFAAVSVVMGLGFTFYSGAVEAWLVDALNDTGFEGSLDSVFARGSMVTGVAMLIGTVGGGVIGQVDLSLPYIVRAVMLLAVLIVAFFYMHDLGFTPHTVSIGELPRAMKRIARASITFGWQKRSVRLLMLYTFVPWGFLTWGFYAWQPYFLELLGRDAVWVAGAIASLVALSTVAGNALVDRISQYCGRRSTMLLWAAGIQTIAAVGIGLTDSFWLAVVLLLIVTGAMGVAGPVKQAFLHQLIPSEQRASVISFDAMIGSGGGILGQTSLGYLSRSKSIADAYFYGGLATVMALPVLMILRRSADPADAFAGQKAGTAQTCAPQGIPPISQVDATAVDDDLQNQSEFFE